MFSKFLTQISSFFFKEIVLKFKYNLKSFEKILDYTGINESYVTYLSNILFISLFFLIVVEFSLIFLMIKLNILFNILSFFVTVFIAFTSAFMIFLLLYKYPYYLLSTKKKKIDVEFNTTIRHLSVLKDEKLSITDVLNVFKNLENNDILSKEAIKIINMTKNNQSLRDTFKTIIYETYSEVEKNFFRKMIDVIDGKENLNQVVSDFLSALEQSRREISEQKKSSVNILFLMSIFLFFFFIIILVILFITLQDYFILRDALLIFAIVFGILEFLLIILLYK